jgi:hypothetical protein
MKEIPATGSSSVGGRTCRRRCTGGDMICQLGCHCRLLLSPLLDHACTPWASSSPQYSLEGSFQVTFTREWKNHWKHAPRNRLALQQIVQLVKLQCILEPVRSFTLLLLNKIKALTQRTDLLQYTRVRLNTLWLDGLVPS